jgi:hypothetical protein
VASKCQILQGKRNVRGVLLGLAASMLGTVMPAAADSLAVSNCVTSTIQVTTYNEYDGLCWIARSQATVPGCGTVTFDCVGRCKLKIEGLGFECANPRYVATTAYTYTVHKQIHGTSYIRGLGTTEWSRNCHCSQAEMQW